MTLSACCPRLGATDGHAKNFSIFLRPGGRFCLTPLYDAMSAQPAVDAGRLRRNGFRFAFAVGENRHYVMATIVPRHFVQTAVGEGIHPRVVDEVCADLADTAEEAISAVLDSLPENFPGALAESVSGGIRERLKVIERFLA